MLIAVLTDTHFGARNDSTHFDIFFQKFYSEVFFTYLRKHEIKTVIHMGDVFDRRKYINFQILRSCREYFFEPLRELGIDMIVIPGNHDTYYKNTNEINSLDLLLKEYSNIEVLQQPTTRAFGTQEFKFIPWICADNYEECVAAIFKKDKKNKNIVMIGHFEIDGFDMFRGIKNDGGMNKELFAQYPVVLTGHFHHRSATDNIYYLGSPYEFTWADHDDPRGFHIIDTETRELEFIENPNKIFHKIYYDDRKKQNLDASLYKKSCVKVVVTHKNDYTKFDNFIESLYNNDVIELAIHEDFSEFESDTLTDEPAAIEDTMTLLSDFVDAIETNEDKEKLKTLLKTLYVEAQHLEP